MLFFSYFLKSRYSKFFNYSSNFYNLVFFLQSHNYSSRNIINSNLFIRSLLDDTTLTEQELLDKFTLYSYENKDVLYSKNLYEFCVSPRIISIVYKKIKGVDFLNSEELNFIYSLNSKLIGESKFLVQIDISSKTLNSNELNSIKSKIDLGLFNCLLLIYSSNNIPLKYKNNFIKFTLTLKQIDLLIAYGFDIKVVTDLNITQQKSLDKPNYYLNLLECFDLEFNLFLKIFLFSSTDKVFLKN